MVGAPGRVDPVSDSASLDAFASAKLAEMERQHLLRRLATTDPREGAVVERGGRRLLNFSSNDYLGLNHHPALKAAAAEAIERYGVGSGASRLVTGNHPLFQALEQRLARLKGSDDAVVFGSGFLTNSGVIPALVGQGDAVFMDELSHACIYFGSRLSGADQFIFRHNDLDHLRQLLEAHRSKHPHAMIVTDGVFSMDGDLAPVGELVAVAGEFDAWLMTDDAHGIGVVGGGRGSSYENGRRHAVPLQMGTLSKAIGGYGGYLCASQPVTDLIRTRCRTFIYSTGLPPANVAAAIAALDLIEADPEFAARPLELARRFTRAINLGLAESPIVPVILGDTDKTMAAGKLLEDEGFLVVPIRPPTVPDGTARLRITFCAGHAEADVDRLAALVRDRVLNGGRP
jgi:8-amino-7-oxononanoate synthase